MISSCNAHVSHMGLFAVFQQSRVHIFPRAANNYFILQIWEAIIRGRLLNGGSAYFCDSDTMLLKMTLLVSLAAQVTSEHLRVGLNRAMAFI